eukprot:CAMPEP_0179076436 /NCGR_PEP_ID=MMETSP0796-20121207/34100_1 /TAXON_ID=73915 /ORGANISM="Pyrodinium bahamense, Strain pbaha01" /LENGTH=242 /DNA_ID=CAMNT_0020773689 /DNA_START=82 /DNA_END=810 /DNA_ORIENTATION=+
MTEDGSLTEKMRKVHWVPLESNPEMLTVFARKVGLQEPWGFTDVFGVDPELLGMVPQPCVAVTLLFKSTENIRKYKEEQRAAISESGQNVSPKVRYLKQYVGNACGTIACIHSLANNAEVLGLAPETPIGKFLASLEGKNPQEAGAMLADATELHSASESSAQGGQTEAPAADADIDNHFICFVEQDGDVYELDGNKAFPINHGPSGGNLLQTATQTIKQKFMCTDPDNIHFNIMALVKQED